MNYVGIDVHKQSFQAAVINQAGDCLEEFRLRSNREGIQQLIERAECFGSYEAVVESSANYWIKLFDVLEEGARACNRDRPEAASPKSASTAREDDALS